MNKNMINYKVYRAALILLSLSILFMAGCRTSEVIMEKSVYDFYVKSIDGKIISLDQYRGKVLLIVNTASKCGFTKQYAGLQELYSKYSSQGFVVLGFPCNQFAGQEPGSEETIKSFCQLNYGVTFPMFAKVNVNGEDADPFFKYLKANLPGLFTRSIKWNFTKFLINREGIPVKRYAPVTSPSAIEKDIEKLLKDSISKAL